MVTGFFPRLIALLALLAAAPAGARDQGAIVGVNRVNLNQLPVPERERIIRQMVENGVRVARINIVHPSETGIETVRIARDNGLALILNIGVLASDYLRPGAAPRPAARKFTARPRLSDLDPARFAERFGWLWKRLEEVRPTILAIEFSNELNWADFNGDLAVGERGTVYDAASLAHMPGRDAYERGLDNYMAVLRIARGLRDGSQVFANVPLVSAGTADVPAAWAARSGGDVVDGEAFLQALKARGLSEVVDGLGLHLYPAGPGWQEHIRRSLRICGREGEADKPCWITEWGVPNNANTCPVDDNRRADLVQRMEADLLRFAADGRLKALIYYDWDTSRAFSIWRCGGLTPSGRIVLD